MAHQPPTRTKLPDEDFDYEFDFSTWAYLKDDPIVSAAVTASPAGLALSGLAAVNSDGNRVQKRISGGTAGTTYTLVCTCTRQSGRVGPVGVAYLEVIAAA
jgi:hypothetical protein